MTVRYSNPEQSPASHYNPDPLARPAKELPDFDGTSYISDRYAEPLRSRYAPIIDILAPHSR